MVAQLLLAKGADVEAEDDDRETALHKASSRGQKTVVELLLKKGADINVRGKYNMTTLQVAAQWGQEEVIRLLLGAGANVNANDGDDYPALHMACNGHETVVRLLLEQGADVDARDKREQTALHVASGNPYGKIVQLLLENGAKIDAKDGHGRTALHKASRNGHELVAQLLLENGADVNAEDKRGRTALRKASTRMREEAQFLKERAHLAPLFGKTLWESSVGRSVGVVKLLLRNGAESSVEDEAALYEEAKKGHPDVRELLRKPKAARMLSSSVTEGRVSKRARYYTPASYDEQSKSI
jgi:ankyrin repeat protein